ncbi:MAG: DMT family transporter [Propionibacteriaceae bacterium]|nr:DMT family transporter [Propionibacteriaceae bacterium]
MSPHDNQTTIGILAVIATEVLYGCSFVFTKDVTTTIDPFTLLGWRFTTALAALLILMAFRVIKVRITRSTVKPLLLLAIFQPLLYYVCETYGVKRTTASESGLIMAAIPVAIIVTAALLLRHRPLRQQAIGIGVTLVGVIGTVVAAGMTANFDLLGYVLLFAAAGSYALYAVFADRHSQAASDIEKTFVMVTAGALAFGTVTVAQHAASHTLSTLATLPFTHPSFAIAVAYLALGSTIGAFFLQNVALSRIGSTRYSTFIGLATLTTLATGAIFLHERLSIGQLVAGLVILAGVYIANRRTDAVARPTSNNETETSS